VPVFLESQLRVRVREPAYNSRQNSRPKNRAPVEPLTQRMGRTIWNAITLPVVLPTFAVPGTVCWAGITLEVPAMRFALLFMAPILLFGDAKNQDWKTGKVLDSATAKTYVPAGDQSTVPAAIFQSMTIRDTQLVIVSDEFAYVIEDTRTQGGFSTVHGAIIHAVSGRHAVEVCR
jgi:hypothetical protein